VDEPATLERAVHDRCGQIRVVKHAAPGLQLLVRGEDHRALLEVSVVHDVEEDVRSIVAVGQVPHLVDHEDVRMRVTRQGLLESALAARA
jgi:hypothetical protein